MQDASTNLNNPNIDYNSAHFKRTFEAMELTNECLFITGKAGTGKSTLLRHFVKNTKKQVVVLAPTGIAAINVGGSTVHSFFRLPFRPIVQDDEEIHRFAKSTEKFKILHKLDTLIIDEVSMLRADLIDAIDQSLRINGGDMSKPFGGKQVIFFGDLFQLEPVVQNNEVERYLFTEYYNSHYFFDARVFQQMHLTCIELRKVFRQTDAHFIALLDAIRLNKAGDADLEKLNTRIDRYFEPTTNDFYVTLCTRNNTAAGINEYNLSKLGSVEYVYKGIVENEFSLKQLPTEQVLVLKEGAQIIFIKNSATGKWVNGTIAKVHSLGPDKIEVQLANGEIEEVRMETWENKLYRWDAMNRRVKSEVIGTFKQYPIKLAWAITIHKSQGLTFDKMILEMGGGAFAHGQLYVALSRCRSMEGLILREPIRYKDIIIDERVVRFAKEFASLEDA
jgi:ATP-dependent exoDNAse (exonuclease V) alpha subunit